MSVLSESVGKILTFRLTDDSFDMLNGFVLWARSTCIVYLCVIETSKLGKLHIHMMFEPIKQGKSAWIQAFHKKFNNRWLGNKSYSCSELKKDKINFYIYCCKGTRFKEPDVMFKISDITNEMVTEYWKKYWEDKPVEEDKTLLQTKKKTQTITWSQQVTIDLNLLYPNHTWYYTAEDIDIIFNYCMKSLGQSSKKLNAFILRDLVLGQLNALSNGHCSGLNLDLKKQAFPSLYGNV